MTEIEAAIARCQLSKLPERIKKRQENCDYLRSQLDHIPFLSMPKIRKDCTHAYYVFPIRYNAELVGVSRDTYIEAVRAELSPTEFREY